MNEADAFAFMWTAIPVISEIILKFVLPRPPSQDTFQCLEARINDRNARHDHQVIDVLEAIHTSVYRLPVLRCAHLFQLPLGSHVQHHNTKATNHVSTQTERTT